VRWKVSIFSMAYAYRHYALVDLSDSTLLSVSLRSHYLLSPSLSLYTIYTFAVDFPIYLPAIATIPHPPFGSIIEIIPTKT
jgi:hypothetical protein